MEATQHYMRLKQRALETIPWKRHGITYDKVSDWLRSEHSSHTSFGAHNWSPLKAGKAIPKPKMELFADFLTIRLSLPDCSVSEIAEYCSPPQAVNRFSWQQGWEGLIEPVRAKFSLPPEALCVNEEDVRCAAKMIMQCVGVQTDPALSGEAALDCATIVMKRSLSEYAGLLIKLWRKNERSVLYATVPNEAHCALRIGASVVAPLHKAFYTKYRDGQCEDIDISDKDILKRSNYLLLDAVAEDESQDWRRAKSKRTLAQSTTVLFQFASLCHPLKQAGVDPLILSLCGTTESMRRLKAYNYAVVGTKTPITGKDIMEFRNSPEYLAGYRFALMRAMLRAYQQISDVFD